MFSARRAATVSHRGFFRPLFALIILITGLASVRPVFGAASWSHLVPAAPGGFPVGSQGSQSTAYDAATDRLIVFGGFADPLNSCCGESQDTWVLSNATGTAGTPTWMKLVPTGPLPPGRRQHSAVYDPVTNRMIVFGGGQFNGTVFNPLLNDLWVLKHANGLGGTPQWLSLPVTGGPPAPRSGHGAVYNPARNEMVIFGGGNNGIMSVPGDLWLLTNANQDTGAQWVGPLPQTGDVPGPIEHFAAAYNPTLDALTIAGGCCGYTNATRLLTNATESSGTPHWMSLTPGGTLPPAGDQAQFGYDQGHNRLITQGPAPGGASNATWQLTEAVSTAPTWINSIPENAPGSPPVDGVLTGSAYNAAQNKFILTLYRIVSGNLIPAVWVLGPPPPPPTGVLAFQGFIAEPVNTATGNYIFQRTDLRIPGRGLPLVFTRTYNTLDPYTGPLGAGWTHAYNVILREAADGTVTIKREDGHEESYSPLGGGRYAPEFTWVVDDLVKNADGSFTLTTKNQTQLQFTSGGQLASIVDRNGNTMTLQYSGGTLVTIIDTVGRAVSLTSDGSNRITALTDPAGRTVRYTYDAQGNLATATDPNGGVMSFAYDGNHRVTQIHDERGNALLANVYDSQGRVSTQSNGRGFTTAFAYGVPGSGQTTITDARGNQTMHTYDAALRLVATTDPNGNTAAFTYDVANNRTGATDPNGHTTQFTYDAKANVTSVTDPLGNLVSLTYDGQNNLTSATNARGFTTVFGYSVPGNLTSIQDAAGKTTVFGYDGFGQLSRKTDARGNQTQYGYDAQGNLTRITDALGGITTLTYDGIGRLLTLTDPNGHTAGATYDANSRLTRIADPLGNATGFTYDAVANLIDILDAKGNHTGYAYDQVNNLTVVTDALAHVTRYVYDANSNRTAVTDANSHTTTYAFDALNRLSHITDPLAHATTYTYDAVGNVTSVKDPNGMTNVFSYDPNNRLTGIAYGDGTSVAYTYDPNGNRVTMADHRGPTGYGYDAMDRPIRVTHPDGAVVRYGYDAVGNRITLMYPDAGLVSYNYDILNRLSQVTDREGQITVYTHDVAGNLIRTSYPNGTAITYQYDASNRLTEIDHKRGRQLLTSVAYTLDQLGNRLTKTKDGKTNDGKFITSYSYDTLSQLVSAITKHQQTAYTYDATGNRLTSASPGKVTQFSYDAADRLLQAGNETFTYDANGNRISMTDGVVTTYAYDAANRLIQVIKGDGTASAYEYDGDGNKVTRTLNGAVSHFTNDVATPLPVLLSEQGPSNISYVHGLGLISQSGAGFKDFYHADGLGSIVLLTDTSGGQVTTYDYDPWGSPVASGHASAAENRFRFAGEEIDDLTGFYYLRARWYDAAVGRFITKDPFPGLVHNPLSLDHYIYVRNRPTRLVDRSGLSPSEGVISNSASPTVAPPKQLITVTSTRAESRFSRFLTIIGDIFDLAGELFCAYEDIMFCEGLGTIPGVPDVPNGVPIVPSKPNQTPA
jgi:RHS repeat-associated protein